MEPGAEGLGVIITGPPTVVFLFPFSLGLAIALTIVYWALRSKCNERVKLIVSVLGIFALPVIGMLLAQALTIAFYSNPEQAASAALVLLYGFVVLVAVTFFILWLIRRHIRSTKTVFP